MKISTTFEVVGACFLYKLSVRNLSGSNAFFSNLGGVSTAPGRTAAGSYVAAVSLPPAATPGRTAHIHADAAPCGSGDGGRDGGGDGGDGAAAVVLG